MRKLSAVASRFFSDQLKTLYKAEFIDGGNELTDRGREHLEVIVLEQHLDELVKSAGKFLQEEKNGRKKKKEE